MSLVAVMTRILVEYGLYEFTRGPFTNAEFNLSNKVQTEIAYCKILTRTALNMRAKVASEMGLK